MQLDPIARPAIDPETLGFLRELKNSGIFDTHYDAWAFGAAYALKEGLEPTAPGPGREPLPPLSTLHEDTRFALEQAVIGEVIHRREKKLEDLTEYVNGLAIAGLRALRARMADWPVAERLKWITEACGRERSRA